MSCTYGGIPLSIPTPEAIAWIELNVTPEELLLFAPPAAAGRSVWAREHPLPLPPVSPGKLFYPMCGAGNFAVGYFLASDAQLAQIRPLHVAQLGTPSSHGLTLYLSSPDGEANGVLQTDLWMLPPRPLVQYPGQNGLWLLTLVDDRYYLTTTTSTGSITVNPGVTTWASLFAALAANTGVSVTVDAISPTYLFPSDSLKARKDPYATYLDTLALNVGHRIVRHWNGTLRSMGNAASQAIQDTNRTAVKKLMSGGVQAWLQDPGYPPDIRGGIPTSVQVLFPQANATTECPAQFDATDQLYVSTVTLAQLALPEYRGVTQGVLNAAKTIHDSATAAYAYGGSNPINQGELDALAVQIATDYYGQALAGVECKIPYIFPWVPEGRNARIIWTYRDDEVSTRIQRDTFNDTLDNLNHYSPTYGSVAEVITGPITFTSGVTFSSPVTFKAANTDCSVVQQGGFWAKLTNKQYNNGQFTKYAWQEVIPGVLPSPLQFTNGAKSGTFSSNPAYHIVAGGSDWHELDDLPADDQDGGIIVRMWKGPGAFYLIDASMSFQFVEKTDVQDVDGDFTGQRLRWRMDTTPERMEPVPDISGYPRPIYIVDLNLP